MNSISNDIEIVELQKAFQKLKDYCNSKIFDIDEPGWEVRRGKAYVKYVWEGVMVYALFAFLQSSLLLTESEVRTKTKLRPNNSNRDFNENTF